MQTEPEKEEENSVNLSDINMCVLGYDKQYEIRLKWMVARYDSQKS